MSVDFSGVYHILITPFGADEEFDGPSMRRVVRFALDQGVNGLIALSVMGEAPKLTDDERSDVLAAVLEEAAGAVPVVAYCSADSTRAAIARARRAEELGVDALLLAPPRAVRAHQLLHDHYLAVADAVGIPLVVQDEPVVAGVDLPVDLLARMLEHENITAVKVEETPTPTKIARLNAASPGVQSVGGLAALYYLEELEAGAVGMMAAFGYPQVLVEIYAAFAAGDHDRAKQTFYRYLPWIRFEAQLPAAPLAALRKRLLHRNGLIASEAARRPCPPLDTQTLQILEGLMSDTPIGM